jgi:CRISPR-associated protein Cmr4
MGETTSYEHNPEKFKLSPDRILFVKAVTSVHAGAGTGVEHIDLPIQREQPTKFPIIYGSSFKGSLREYAIRKLWSSLTDNCKEVITLEDIDKLIEQLSLEKDKIKEICKKFFEEKLDKLRISSGNIQCLKQNTNKEAQDCIEIKHEKGQKQIEIKTTEAGFCKKIKTLAEIFGTQDNRGKITFTDLRILFFPVKSLKGVFAYVTCPYVLKRFYEQVKDLIENENENENTLKSLIENLKFDKNSFKAYVTNDSYLVLQPKNEEKEEGKDKGQKKEKYIVLEEFAFKAEEILQTENNNGNNLNISKLKDLLSNGELYELEKRIVIVPDEIFAFLVQHYTEVVTRIKINPETGTVQEGALWTEEYLPAESVLYSVLFKQETSRDLKLKDYLPNDGELLNLGGNQTIGKGLVKVWYYPKNTSESPDREG